jgi:phytoene dehydrogenase-like protein
MPQAPVVIVGAGASGLSAAALQRRGIDPVVLEQDSALGGTWARRYDGLHPHTVRAHSGLAHRPIRSRESKYLSRDELVNVLKRGLLQIRPELVRLTPTQAVYADGRSEPSTRLSQRPASRLDSLGGHLFEANRASRKLAANVDRYLPHALPISG